MRGLWLSARTLEVKRNIGVMALLCGSLVHEAPKAFMTPICQRQLWGAHCVQSIVQCGAHLGRPLCAEHCAVWGALEQKEGTASGLEELWIYWGSEEHRTQQSHTVQEQRDDPVQQSKLPGTNHPFPGWLAVWGLQAWAIRIKWS